MAATPDPPTPTGAPGDVAIGLEPLTRVGSELSTELTDLMAAAGRYAEAAVAPNTVRAYASDWRLFEAWTDERGLRALPAAPAAVALFLTHQAGRGLALATIRKRATSIGRVHRDAGHPTPMADPNVKRVLEDIARTHHTAPDQKHELLRDQIIAMVNGIDVTETAGLRDRALLLLGFALGLRRSELVQIQVEDLSPRPVGLRVRLPRSKTDHTGTGHTLLLAYAETGNPCPVRALWAWTTHAGLTSGPVARRLNRNRTAGNPLSAQSIALIVKTRARAAGLDPAKFAGHSLRSGYATQAVRDGHRTEQIADVTRHKDRRTLDGYIRAGHGKNETASVL